MTAPAVARDAGVVEAGVVGAPDEEWGEVVVAFIVGDATPEDLEAGWYDELETGDDDVSMPDEVLSLSL